MLKGAGMVSPVADALGAHGTGAIGSSVMQWLAGLVEVDEGVEKLHRKLADALASQEKRYLVVIDDIDRLVPEEAFAMFRLVKSAGRLPNVAYLLAFDRTLAERMVAERFPSVGPHYLEKIVQVSFELPVPSARELGRNLEARLFKIVGTPGRDTIVHVMNLLLDIVVPEITTPRDLVRYLNAISITWPAVAGEVDLGDFLALEAYRLFRPAIYRAVRANPGLICGPAATSGRETARGELLDQTLLSSVENAQHYRRGLMRLFPRLEAVWSKVFHRSDARWSRQRRACSNDHFATYFQLAPGDTAMSRAEFETLLEQAGDPDVVAKAMREGVAAPRRDGGTRAATILDTLRLQASNVPLAKAESILAGVFKVADSLDVEEDNTVGFAHLRIHWLMRAMLEDRTDIATRSEILRRCSRFATLGWLVDLASSAWGEYHPRPDQEMPQPADRLLSEEATERLTSFTLGRIKSAARDGSLLHHPSLASILYNWRTLARDDGKAVMRWTTARLEEDASVIVFAKAFTSASWSQGLSLHGLGDLVAARSDNAQVGGLDKILDGTKFRLRTEQLAKDLDPSSPGAGTIKRFLDAWIAQERRPH